MGHVAGWPVPAHGARTPSHLQIDYYCRLDCLWKKKFKKEREEFETMESVNRLLLENVLPAHVAAHFIGDKLNEVWPKAGGCRSWREGREPPRAFCGPGLTVGPADGGSCLCRDTGAGASLPGCGPRCLAGRMWRVTPVMSAGATSLVLPGQRRSVS